MVPLPHRVALLGRRRLSRVLNNRSGNVEAASDILTRIRPECAAFPVEGHKAELLLLRPIDERFFWFLPYRIRLGLDCRAYVHILDAYAWRL